MIVFLDYKNFGYRIFYRNKKEILNQGYELAVPIFLYEFNNLMKEFGNVQLIQNVFLCFDDDKSNLWRTEYFNNNFQKLQRYVEQKHKNIENAHKKKTKERGIGYKSNRLKSSADQFDVDRCFQILDEFLLSFEEISDLKILKINQCEADDLIAVGASYYSYLGHKVVVISGDKDCRQLLSDENIDIYQLHNKGNQLITTVEKDFLLKHIILGDQSDGILNCMYGIGDKKVKKIIDNLPEYLKKEEFKEIFIFNNNLINFSKIPITFQKKIVNSIDSKMYKYNFNFNKIHKLWDLRKISMSMIPFDKFMIKNRQIVS